MSFWLWKKQQQSLHDMSGVNWLLVSVRGITEYFIDLCLCFVGLNSGHAYMLLGSGQIGPLIIINKGGKNENKSFIPPETWWPWLIF